MWLHEDYVFIPGADTSTRSGFSVMIDIETAEQVRGFHWPLNIGWPDNIQNGAQGEASVIAASADAQRVLTVGDDGVGDGTQRIALWDLRDLVARPRFVSGDNGKEILWDLGTLQFSPTTTGPWTDLPTASPFQLSPIGERGFFRVKVEE